MTINAINVYMDDRCSGIIIWAPGVCWEGSTCLNVLPNWSLKFSTVFLSSSVKMVLSNFANTGIGKYHSTLDVNPLALFEVSCTTGSAACGCVKPREENDVRSILKLALPVTENMKGGNEIINDGYVIILP